MKLSFHDWASMGFGLGLMPASGTMGSLLGLVLGLLCNLATNWVQVCLIGLVGSLIWWSCCQTYHTLGESDHTAIVGDEVLGMWLAVCLHQNTLIWLIIGFGLFRLLDISKIGPVGWAETLPIKGHAVMLDDVVAGVMTNVFLRLIS